MHPHPPPRGARRHSPIAFLGALTIAGAALGCATTSPPTARKPPGRQPPATAHPAAPAPLVRWHLQYGPGQRAYAVRTRTAVTLTNADTAGAPVERADSGYAHYTVAVTPDSAGQLTLSGVVDSSSVESGDTLRSNPDSAAPARFSGVLSPAGSLVSFEQVTGSLCAGGTDPAVAGARELFVPLPAAATVGTIWRDTSTVVICRGGIPVTTTTVRDYRLTGAPGWHGTAALRIERSAVTTVTGDGAQTEQHATVAGAGRGVATIYLDPSTGALFALDGSADLQLTVVVPSGSYAFRQRSTVAIRRAP